MIVLAVECASKSASVALLKDENVIGEIYLNPGKHHAEILLPALERLLRFTGMTMDDTDLLACTKGPGSFTGVRIAISTIKGLALAAGKPIVGISTLEVLAMNLCPSPNVICTLLDARKNQLYFGLYRSGENGMPEKLADDRLEDIQTIFRELPGEPVDFIGDGAVLYRNEILSRIPTAKIFNHDIFNKPRASALGLIAYQRYRQGLLDDLVALAPVYLRLPDAELKNPSGIRD